MTRKIMKLNIKKLQGLWLILLLILILASVGIIGAFQKTPSPKRVAIFPYLLKNEPFIRGLTNELNQQLYHDYSLTIQTAQNSQVIQSEQIQTAMNQNPLALCINPVDRLGSYSIIKALRKRNIPVVFFNRQPLLRDLRLYKHAYYVGSPARQSGELQAELLDEVFKASKTQDKNRDGEIQIVFFKGEQGHQDAELRFAAVVSRLAAMGYKLDIIAIETANWRRDIARKQMLNLLLRKEKRIEAVVASNDAMALGVVDAIKEMGVFIDTNKDGRMSSADTSWFPILGIDGIDEAHQALKEGYLYATVYNNEARQAQRIAEIVRLLDATAEAGGPEVQDFIEAGIPLEDEHLIWVPYEKLTRSEL